MGVSFVNAYAQFASLYPGLSSRALWEMIGVTQMQGWLYSAARPLEEIDALFDAQELRKSSAA